nr:CbiQ family ECF transporter T component [Protofrankia coriariae]
MEDLSGGQMRRAALAGLIACRPRLMILDEPLAGLDASSSRILIDVLVNLRIRTGLTLVVVSHDFDDMACLTERMLVLDGGRLVHDGPFTDSITDGTLCRPLAPLPHPRPAGAGAEGCLLDDDLNDGTFSNHDDAFRIQDSAAQVSASGTGNSGTDNSGTDSGGSGDGHVDDAGRPGRVPARGPAAAAPQPPSGSSGNRSARGLADRCRGRFFQRRPARHGRRTEPNLLRYIPGDTPVHRLWAGTKLIIMALLGVLVAVRPSWPVIGMIVGFVGLSMIVARIPVGAAPRLPRWFWYGLLIGVLLTAQSHAAPFVTVGGVRLSIGGMLDWLRLTSASMTMFAAAALLGWTTPLSELAPALGRLLAPLRRLRLPIDEWVATVALSIRCLPLLVDEIRMLLAVRRLRVGARPPRRRLPGLLAALPLHARSITELLCTAIVTCLRRAAEMTEAIAARGGFGAVAHQPARPRRVDAAALAALAGLAVAAFLV